MVQVTRWVLIVGVTAVAVRSPPDIARHFKLRSL